MGEDQKHSKVYTGHKGTNYDSHEVGIPDGQIREKRNTRMTGSQTSVSSYIEGHSNSGLLLDVSETFSLLLDETKITLQSLYTLSFTLDKGAPLEPENISVSFIYESLENAYEEIAKAISNTQNYKAATIGNNVLVCYNNPSPSASNSFDLTITNIVTNSAGSFSYTSISPKSSKVYPMCYWSLNTETVMVTVVPTQEVIDGTATSSLVQLWRIVDNGDGTISSKELKYNNFLNYVLTRKPIIRAVIENGCIHRVYITEGSEPMRSFNVGDKNLFAIPPLAVSITPQIFLSSVEVIEMENGGLLPTGGIQYTYRIISKNGSVSLNAPLSNVIYLPPGNLEEPSFKMYGDEAETISNKSVSIRIDGIDTQYERIQVIAVYRQTELAITDVEIIYDGSIETGVLNVVHSRKGDGVELTIGELLLDNKVWDVGETLEIHENHLLTADLTGRQDSLADFDSIIRQYDTNGNTYSQKFNPDPDTYKYCKDQANNIFGLLGQWIQGGQSNGYENGSGVKMWYHIDEAVVDEGFRYRGGGYTTDTDIENLYGSDEDNQNILVRNFEPGRVDEPKVTDLHHGGYVEGSNNPLMGSEYAGYQQMETYRIGMVLTKNGKDSQVLFLGDFKIPAYEEDYVEVNKNFRHSNFVSISNDIKNSFAIARHQKYVSDNKTFVRQWSRSVKMRFDVRLPDEIKKQYDGFKFVRVERRDGERTVFGQGIMHQVVQYFDHTDDKVRHPHRYFQGKMDEKYGPSPWSKYIYKANKDKHWMLSSPDQIFNVDQYTYFGGDKIYLVADLEQYRLGIDQNKNAIPNLAGQQYDSRAEYTSPRASVFGILEHKNPSTFPSRELEIENGYHVNAGATIPNSALGLSDSFINESRGPIMAGTQFSLTGMFRMYSTQGTIFELKAVSGVQPTQDVYGAALVEIHREIPNQYGGKNEFALSNAQWIEMGAVVPIDKESYNVVVGGGDIYANLTNFTKYDDSIREQRDYLPYSGNNAASAKQISGGGWSIAIPTNSLGNYAFGHGEHWGGGHPSYDYITPSTHLFNRAFMAKNDVRRFIYIRDSEICKDVRYYGTVAVSRSKINGETLDKWLDFPAFDFFEVDLSLGRITHLISQKSMLWVVQESGIGILSFDPLAITQTEDGAEIQILSGSGKKIRKLQQVSKMAGSRHKHFRIDGKDGTYIIDDINYEVYLFTEKGYKAMADDKGYGLWLRKMLKNKNVPDMPLVYKGIHGYYDSEHKEIVIQIDQP